MIFVILGIIILVVSFVIALISLIREQHKLVKEIETKGEEADIDFDKPATRANNIPPQGRPQTQEEAELTKIGQGSIGGPSDHRERFPWEENKEEQRQNLWEDKSETDQSQPEGKLVGEISLSEIAKKNRR